MKLGGRRFRLIGRCHAKRLPKGLEPTRSGELVQIDTLFGTRRPQRDQATSPLWAGRARGLIPIDQAGGLA